MKKIIGFTLVCCICVVSCKKSETVSLLPSTNDQLKIEDGRLVFKTENIYADYIGNSNIKQSVKLLKGKVNFNGFQSEIASAKVIGNCNVPDSIIDNNPDFFNILNADGVVQISNHLYRYDFCGNKTWVISTGNAKITSYYSSFLKGEEISAVVGAFPNYVDVIEAINAGYTTMPPPSTVVGNEIFEPPTTTTVNGFLEFHRGILEEVFINNNEKDLKDVNVLMDGKLQYDLFGIYFQFFGKEKYKTRCFFNWCTETTGRRDWNVSYSFNYRRKGSTNVVSGSGVLSPINSNENKVEKIFYAGNRGLRSGFNFATFDVNNLFTNKMALARKVNGSPSTYFIASYGLPTFQFKNNFQFPNAPTSHFSMGF